MEESISGIIAAILNGDVGCSDDKRHTILMLYFDDLCGSVYKNRYRLRYKPKYFRGKKDDNFQDRHDEDDLEDAVSYSDFLTAAWIDMQAKLHALACKDDAEIRRYLSASIKNHLEQMIYNLSPGLQTRVKQLKLLLPEICDQTRTKEWQLKDDFLSRDLHQKTNRMEIAMAPTAQSMFLGDASKIPLPEVRQPKAGSEYGPSIKREDMKRYLVALFNVAGGVIHENQLIDFVKDKFSLYSIHQRERHTDMSWEDDEPDRMDRYPMREQILISHQYVQIAEEVLSGMSIRQKQLYKWAFTDGISHVKIANTLNVSNATVSGEIKKIQAHIRSFLNRSEYELSEEECMAIVELMGQFIERDMNHEKEAN